MPKIERIEEGKQQVTLRVEVSVEEAKPFLERTAKEISDSTEIPGFRKGKAPFEQVQNHIGAMKLFESALESIIRSTYLDAIESEDIHPVGSPYFDVEKMVPSQPLVYTAKIDLMPEVTKLADHMKLSAKREEVEVKDGDVDGALNQMRKMQQKEVRTDKDYVATKDDAMTIDLHIKKEGVEVEGGHAHDYRVYLNEEHYIPGFNEELIGMKEGGEKTFKLTFPESHFQKHLAGSEAEFEVKVKGVFTIKLPELDDKFAESIGQKSLGELKDVLKKNIEMEKVRESKLGFEKALLSELAEKSKFTDISERLVNEEVNKMIYELQRTVTSQGIEFETYLNQINKTMAQLKMDFTPQAIERIKVSLVLRELAKKESIEVDEKAVDEELDRIAAQYEDKETKKRIYDPEYRAYTKSVMTHQKTIDKLVELSTE